MTSEPAGLTGVSGPGPASGVAKDVPVGFQAIRLTLRLDTDASDEQIATLVRLTERYCVVYQTLAHPAAMTVARQRAGAP